MKITPFFCCIYLEVEYSPAVVIWTEWFFVWTLMTVCTVSQAVYEAMWELKSHEYIENHFIMDTLKKRLQSRKVKKTSFLHGSSQYVHS